MSEIEVKPMGFRVRAGQSLTTLATVEATARAARAELGHLPTPAELAAALVEAEQRLSSARTDLSQAQLSDEESVLTERLAAATDGRKQLQERHGEVREELHKLQGALSKSAGMHQARAEAAAVVDGLTRQTKREILKSRAPPQDLLGGALRVIRGPPLSK